MKNELITCYAIMGYKFPNRPAYEDFLRENKGIFLGEKNRFGSYVEPLFFKTPHEAENWMVKFLKKQPDVDEFDLKVVECKIEREIYDRHFKIKNYFIKIETLPHKILESRPNLKPVYLRGELVLGLGNTIARSGHQRWFETEKEAREYMEGILICQDFQGIVFKIAKAPEKD